MRLLRLAKAYARWAYYKVVTERALLDRYRQEHGHALSLDFPQECYQTRFELAFDLDSTPVQYGHVAYTYPTGALCGTQLLWFHAGPLDEKSFQHVNCPVCLHLWERRGLTLGGAQ